MRRAAHYISIFTVAQSIKFAGASLKPFSTSGQNYRGDCHQVQVDHLNDQESAWVHAYLHRKEGDIENADYWYRKARKSRPNLSLDEEWEALVLQFL